MKKKYIVISFLFFLILIGCKSSPKVIKSVNNTDQNATVPIQSTGIFTNGESNSGSEIKGISTNTDGMHNVRAIEVIEATKYVYVKVKEGEAEYWIATIKQNVEVGKNYFYKDGLLKTNFESKEHNRVFDRIYLVSKIIPTDHVNHGSISTDESAIVADSPAGKKETDLVKMEGSISIGEILENVQHYKGKEVQISGRCVKVNPNIMGRNWVHLVDGTQGDFDMVATTSIPIPEGNVVTLKGIINVDVDFGAGYKYDVIMEDAVVVNMQ